MRAPRAHIFFRNGEQKVVGEHAVPALRGSLETIKVAGSSAQPSTMPKKASRLSSSPMAAKAHLKKLGLGLQQVHHIGSANAHAKGRAPLDTQVIQSAWSSRKLSCLIAGSGSPGVALIHGYHREAIA